MSFSLSRRKFGQLLGASGVALALGEVPAAAAPLAPVSAAGSSGSASRTFPPGFLWGSSTAAYQVEGAAREGGRGPSVWDTFSHTFGKTTHGDTGDVTDDFFHRYKQDIRLMQDLGLKSCRFSVAWTRIFPDGGSQPNQQGLDFYKRLTEALVEAGIAPHCTLYHWDLPQPLQDRGGWENRDTAKRFADYAGFTAGKLAGTVKCFMTMNEIRTFIEAGNVSGKHAPGLHLDPTRDAQRIAQMSHHAVLGHGLAVQAIRAQAGRGVTVGIADNPVPTCPVVETPEHIEAARHAMREVNAMYLTVIEEGRYTDLYLNRLGADAPKFTLQDLKEIASPLDFVGLNVYQPLYVRADGSKQGYATVPNPSSYPHMDSEWLSFGPEGLYWAARLTAELWKVKEIYITENGTSSTDTVAQDGHVYDTDRVMFLRSYLTQLQRAIADGVPVKGYSLWSLLDNFEWNDGFNKRFGIVYVDFKTEQRIPKLSAEFYKSVIASNRVL